MLLRKIINKLFFDYSWFIALGKCSNLKDIPTTEFELLHMPRNHWAADPFLLKFNDEYAVVFEYTNTKKDKSALALSLIKETTITEPKVIYEFEGHTSYPCAFNYKDTQYIIPETMDNRKIYLLKCVEWPYKWENVSILHDDISAVDTTVFDSNNGLKAFVYTIDDKNYNNRKLYLADFDVENGKFENLVCINSYSNRDGRPGGSNLTIDCGTYRVVQPFTKIYGEKIEIRFFDFNHDVFSEKTLQSLYPNDIHTVNNVKGVEMVGIHTLNILDGYTVVDLRGCLMLDIFKPIKFVFKIFNLFGYGMFEKRKKMVGLSKF